MIEYLVALLEVERQARERQAKKQRRQLAPIQPNPDYILSQPIVNRESSRKEMIRILDSGVKYDIENHVYPLMADEHKDEIRVNNMYLIEFSCADGPF